MRVLGRCPDCNAPEHLVPLPEGFPVSSRDGLARAIDHEASCPVLLAFDHEELLAQADGAYDPSRPGEFRSN